MQAWSQMRSWRNSGARERIDELSVLPVFFNLKGKTVLVAGGTDAAAWKSELLAASGAQVMVCAPAIDGSFDALIRSGKCSWFNDTWTPAHFSGVSLALCDAATDAEAAAFSQAAHAAGVPANVIDKPDYCDFQFGSIVNRSPAVIAISTNGAAPILGQAIRRRIEILLPKFLSEWVALAQDIRAGVMQRLDTGLLRRAFWERFAEQAFRANPPTNAKQVLLDDCHRLATYDVHKTGSVTLVGAGPGDAELLTVKAVRALQAADVILFDHLVSSEVIELARREARRVLVGKRGGRDSCRQDDINSMMIRLVRAGKNVVRLKGGDPMIFGRAGEELDSLDREGIAVTVIPGITAASALAASLGVSLTHRDCAQSVRFITGHSRHGELPQNIDWSNVASACTTTIFYMGGRTASAISQKLQAGGMAGTTPVVVMSAISCKDEQRWTGELDQLAQGVKEIGFDQPVLIGIGSVFKSTIDKTDEWPLHASISHLPAVVSLAGSA